MQLDYVLKKLNFDLLHLELGGGGGQEGGFGVGGGLQAKTLATTLPHLLIPFNLKCNVTMFQKS